MGYDKAVARVRDFLFRGDKYSEDRYDGVRGEGSGGAQQGRADQMIRSYYQWMRVSRGLRDCLV